MDWKEIASVPLECDLEVAVIDKAGIYPIGFACRYRDGIWINANTRKPLEINPTHWREWNLSR